jgi:hypothetical protein
MREADRMGRLLFETAATRAEAPVGSPASRVAGGGADRLGARDFMIQMAALLNRSFSREMANAPGDSSGPARRLERT